jgi:GTP cyclohydrolase II
MDHRLVLGTRDGEPVTALPAAGQGPYQHEQD